jgi:L-fuconolactonase
MIIDAHQHFWRYAAEQYGWIDEPMAALRRDFTPEESAHEMSAIDVGACVAVQARQTLDETRWLLELAEAHPSIAGVVGWVDLQTGARQVRAQLASFAGHPRLVGMRHIVQAEPDDRFLLRPQVLDGLAVLADFAIDVWERDIRALAAHHNVFAKLSGLVTEADWSRWTPADIRPYLDVAFDAFGWQRLMIGSDWPVCMVAGSYSRTMRVVLDYLAVRPAHEQAAVLGGNAQRFWRLNSDEAGDARGTRAPALRSRV